MFKKLLSILIVSLLVLQSNASLIDYSTDSIKNCSLKNILTFENCFIGLTLVSGIYTMYNIAIFLYDYCNSEMKEKEFDKSLEEELYDLLEKEVYGTSAKTKIYRIIGENGKKTLVDEFYWSMQEKYKKEKIDEITNEIGDNSFCALFLRVP
jgi:hypothetical protein